MQVKGKKKNQKIKCPSCEKSYESMKDMDRHCLNYHRKSYTELKKMHENKNMTLGDFMPKGDEEDE